jgi:hypothetical protein
MVLKLPKDLLEFVQSQCNDESYQTFIIKLLREQQQSFTKHRGNLNGERKDGVQTPIRPMD